MRKTVYTAVLAISVGLVMPFCKKSGSTSTDPCKSEATLSVTTVPANGSTEAPSVGPNFPLTVTINSSLPGSGVTIEVVAHPESNTTNFFKETKPSSTKVTDFSISGTPSGVVCVAEITVTSKSCATNKWTGSYRYSKK